MRARLSEDELKSEFRVQNQELRTEIELLFGPRRAKTAYEGDHKSGFARIKDFHASIGSKRFRSQLILRFENKISVRTPSDRNVWCKAQFQEARIRRLGCWNRRVLWLSM